MKYEYNKNNKINTFSAIREDTGEIIEVVSRDNVRQRGKKFIQIYGDAQRIMRTFSEKDAVLFYLIDKMGTSDNLVFVTYKEISIGANVSLRTVTRIIDYFESIDILRIIRRGKIMVNPNMFLKCDSSILGKLIHDYFSIDKHADNVHTNTQGGEQIEY